MAIKELKKSINSKLDKSELDLNSKCDKAEMNQIISDLKKTINTKASNEQVNQLLNDKITKNEVLFYLSNKPSTDDINNILEEKISIREFEEVLNQINLIKDEKIDINVFNSEIQEIKDILETKSNSIDVVNALDTKVDKDELNFELKNLTKRKELNNLLEEKKDKFENQKIYEILNEQDNEESANKSHSRHNTETFDYLRFSNYQKPNNIKEFQFDNRKTVDVFDKLHVYDNIDDDSDVEEENNLNASYKDEEEGDGDLGTIMGMQLEQFNNENEGILLNENGQNLIDDLKNEKKFVKIKSVFFIQIKKDKS